jgi:hypothetical protein
VCQKLYCRIDIQSPYIQMFNGFRVGVVLLGIEQHTTPCILVWFCWLTVKKSSYCPMKGPNLSGSGFQVLSLGLSRTIPSSPDIETTGKTLCIKKSSCLLMRGRRESDLNKVECLWGWSSNASIPSSQY